ncbi:MAG TPA: AraC family transcriptional regulator, partial [Bacteroidetes bacterium]|nr:AraC family transcriptional regulator [Bacteroidota bacterium]
MKNRSLSAYHHLPILDGMELLSAKAHTLDFPFHRHDTLTLSLIFDTPFHTQLPDKCITAIPGTLTITNPDEVHATPCDPDFGNSFFTYYVSPDIFRKISRGKSFFFEDRIIDDAALFQELYFLSNNIKHTSIDFETR